MDKILVDLIKETSVHGKGALQELREAFGFDYNKPIKVAKIKGTFNYTSLKKEYEIDAKNEKVAVVFAKNNCRRFYVADFTGGKIELVNNFYFYILYPIWTKSEANDWRTNGYYTTYIISQSYTHTLPIAYRGWKGVSSLDMNTRYRAVRPNDPSFGVVEYDHKTSARKRFDVDFDGDVFDKSGYPVSLKRKDLAERLKAIRDAKGATAYKAMTNRKDMIEKVKKAIEAKKIELSTRLLDCNTADTINNFGNDLISFRGLYGCYRDLEETEKMDRREEFKSPEAFNSAISLIYGKLARI